jgi:hypothetical protein
MKISLKSLALFLVIIVILICYANAPLKTLYYKTGEYAYQKKWLFFSEAGVEVIKILHPKGLYGIPVNMTWIMTGSACFGTGW